MKKSITREVKYFKYCGEVNTEEVLRTVRSRCQDTSLGKVIVASETGRSAVRALDIFRGASIELVVVTHYPATTWGPKGKISIGLKSEEYTGRLKKLEAEGVPIVQGTRPF
ncbi:hypothetical protein GWN63_01810, partial [Candidatus Bathyarchaeota archaeon]|nr:hypothetical protein [Candidatus Bathyarchaeota archaeon]NIR14866.1 hypothetical protein [Desulfobacterales bacterium]NIU80972.1 hypothetical protein [Candidatus Bathyarchaeota archaeon]NIV67619.1 hypothetical protein [Candidatus Bathyarchaeota archaeon]NIW34247.1 hypothetical protein [Candidatus Bathyarchaeota archaeon]